MALINNNADEIFTLQSLHNQGIGSGGGGGGDIGNFISVGRDPNSFPGFYSIAMGNNSIAGSEGGIAVGDDCCVIATYGGVSNGKNNLEVSYDGWDTYGGAIFGYNNIATTNYYGGNLISGSDNLYFPMNFTPTLGTNLFIGYWDNSSKILYADREKTEIVEFTVPAGGAIIIDYNPDLASIGRDLLKPAIYYTPDGINYTKFSSSSNYGTLICGNSNKLTGFISNGSNVVGYNNTLKRSGTSFPSAGASSFFSQRIDSTHIFGVSNKVDYCNDTSMAQGLFVTGYYNTLDRATGAVVGCLNKVSNINGTKNYHYVIGKNNDITDSAYSYNATVVIGESNKSSGITSYNNVLANNTYGNYIIGLDNQYGGNGGQNYIHGAQNRIGLDVIKITKTGDDYYQISYTWNDSTHTWDESSSIINYWQTSYVYLYNNKLYYCLSDRSGLDLDHPISSAKLASPNGTTYQTYIYGDNNTAYYSNHKILVGFNNKSYGNQDFIFGSNNKGGYCEGANNVLIGYKNFAVGKSGITIGSKLINVGAYNILSGTLITTGYEDDSDAFTPKVNPCLSSVTPIASDKYFCQKNGQLYDTCYGNNGSFHTPTIDQELRTESVYDDIVQNPSSNGVYTASYTISDSYNDTTFKYNANTQRFELCFDPEYIDLQETGVVATTIHGINNGAFKGTANTIEGLNNYINHYKTVGCHLEGSSIILNDNVYRFAAHAEGYNTYIGASYAHAEGYMTRASGEASHAGGNNTIAQGANQTAIGKFNIADTNNAYAFIIGNGAAEATRANALTVDWSGNLTIAGSLSMPNLTIVNRGDLTNKAYVDDYITDAYDDTETYDVGDYCIYNNTLYRCIATIAVAESFTSAHWAATTIAEELQTKQNSSDNSLNTTNKTIVGAINELESKLWTDFDNVLTAGATTVTVTDASITATSAIDVYTNVWGVEPTNMVLATGSVTLTFEAQASDINVKVRVS